jgi:hypothetical protein
LHAVCAEFGDIEIRSQLPRGDSGKILEQPAIKSEVRPIDSVEKCP